jgi:hypothetical protein
MREAEMRSLRDRIARLPEVEPADDEVAAIAAGGKEFDTGKFTLLNDLDDVGDRSQQPRTKKPRRRSRR